MPYTSPYFKNTTGYTGEVSLLDDLVKEQIRMYGIDVMYLPRKMLNLDKLLHESTKNAFEIALPMPMYVKTFDGYDNGLEALTKFGVRSSDELTLQMSRSEFTTYYAPYLKSYYNGIDGRPDTSEVDRFEGQTAHRPKEGDLIYFPLDGGIFEIKYVMFDQPFFQLGKGYVFELQCEKFEYSGATFSTGYDEIDDSTIQPDYYRIEFNIIDLVNGPETFIHKERVWIYNLTGMNIDEIDGGVSYSFEFYKNVDGGDVYSVPEETIHAGHAPDWGPNFEFGGFFQLDKDPGYPRRVEMVEGSVEYWNKPQKIITLSDLTDLDPEHDDDKRDLTINKFDEVVIIGQTSGAICYTRKAATQDKAFDDGTLIQEEFDKIKVIDDPGDINPFGFV